MKLLDSHFCFILILLVLLLSSSHVSARFLTGKHQGETEVELKNAMAEVSTTLQAEVPTTLQPENDDTFDMLMGLEKCEKGDKECFTRRVLEEAHLDYIYTQHHKP